MSTYDIVIPRILPHILDLPIDKVSAVVSLLINASDTTPAGSSFAVSAALHDPNVRRMYLSDASLDRVRKAGLLNG